MLPTPAVPSSSNVVPNSQSNEFSSDSVPSNIQQNSLCESAIVGSPEVFGAMQENTTSACAAGQSAMENHVLNPSPNLGKEERMKDDEANLRYIRAPVPMRHSPPIEELLNSLNHWQWVQIDDVHLPIILREDEHYAAVHMVQLKLLNKFPSGLPADVMQRFTMVSHHMTEIEACVFNAVNVVSRSFDLGCHVYTVKDEVVRLQDALAFYWHAKEYNLHRTYFLYEKEISTSHCNSICAVLSVLKQECVKAIEKTRDEIAANYSIAKRIENKRNQLKDASLSIPACVQNGSLLMVAPASNHIEGQSTPTTSAASLQSRVSNTQPSITPAQSQGLNLAQAQAQRSSMDSQTATQSVPQHCLNPSIPQVPSQIYSQVTVQPTSSIPLASVVPVPISVNPLVSKPSLSPSQLATDTQSSILSLQSSSLPPSSIITTVVQTSSQASSMTPISEVSYQPSSLIQNKKTPDETPGNQAENISERSELSVSTTVCNTGPKQNTESITTQVQSQAQPSNSDSIDSKEVDTSF